MRIKNTLGYTLVLLLCGQLAWAAAPAMTFQKAKGPQDVFGSANTIYSSYMPFKEWKTKQSGKFFPMDATPVLTGIRSGGVPMPAPVGVNPAKYKDQAKEFAIAVNMKNEGGRYEGEGKPGDESALHMVQTVLAATVDRPYSQMKLSTEKFAAMAAEIDLDHYHFRIPGSFVLEALEKDHAAARTVNPDQAYLLSVIDFRDYGCAVMKNGLRDYFSKMPQKQRLLNESIYLISDLSMNEAEDMAAAEKYFGKRPDAVLTQRLVWADHLIQGAQTSFIFFAEGDKTRVVLLSNISMKSKFFTGSMGLVTRQYIMGGIGGGVTEKALKAKDALTDLLTGATGDVSNKNSCDRGLALGLERYSQQLFGEFNGFVSKN